MKVIKTSTIYDVLDKIGTRISSPEQRLIQGFVAIGVQPLIDFRNKEVDDDTRAVSVARTIGKIVAGTCVGVGVRALSISLAKNLSKFRLNDIAQDLKIGDKLPEGLKPETIITSFKKASKGNVFTPKMADYFEGRTVEQFQNLYNNFFKAWGTILATGAMVFTNFLIDVPITKAITKKLTPKVKEKIEQDNQRKQVNNVAC